MVKYYLLAVLLTFWQLSSAMQEPRQIQQPVSRKLQLLCKFLEEDEFQKELQQKKAENIDYSKCTIAEHIALELTNDEFEKINKSWLRSSISVMLLKYPPLK